MKILSITSLGLPEIKVIQIKRFVDNRGYFLEAFRSDVLLQRPELPELVGKQFSQLNESRSIQDVVRGLHTQSNPNIDKLLRILKGKIIDVVLDIRVGSPTFGKAVAYELKYSPDADYEEMLFIPFGFAHGIIALEGAHIQYLQTGVWNSAGEATIQFKSEEIDWSLIDKSLKNKIQQKLRTSIMTPKDEQGKTLAEWENHPLAAEYQFKKA